MIACPPCIFSIDSYVGAAVIHKRLEKLDCQVDILLAREKKRQPKEWIEAERQQDGLVMVGV